MPKKEKHTGDDGTTLILHEERLPKFHPRIETLGALDEASAALGFARSLMEVEETARLILEIQKKLYILMAEIAAPNANNPKLPSIQCSDLEWLENLSREMENQVELPHEFIVPGDSVTGAAIAMARTTIRRAERQVAKLVRTKGVKNRLILPWLNRLSSLLFLLEVSTIKISGIKPTTVK